MMNPTFKKLDFQVRKFFVSKYFTMSINFITLIARPLFFEENVFQPFKE